MSERITSWERLRTLIASPEHGAANCDWEMFTRVLGFAPPADFVRIVETYGAGVFAGETSVWVPGGDGGEDLYRCAPLAFTELVESREWIDEYEWRWVEPDGATSPVELGAEPIRFSAWGAGASGSYGYWHRIGDDPDQWPVLYTDLRDLWFYHRGGIAAFLVDIFSGNYPSDQIELDVPDGPDFVPYPG